MPAPGATELGTWRGLDSVGRIAWLRNAQDRWSQHGRHSPRRDTTNEVFTIDGDDFDDVTGFLCAFGEAVNGPGGYFGVSLRTFDDCLFGGFGLEAPCTLRWVHSARSRTVLDGAAFARWCADEIAWIDTQPPVEPLTEARALLQADIARGERGELTLFEEILDRLQSVEARFTGRPGWRIDVRLE
jgi:hypothetical protein